MVRKKIREFDSKRLLKQHLPRLASIDLPIFSAQITESTDFTELLNQEPRSSSRTLVVKPDMLFGNRGKSGLVGLNLGFAQVVDFINQHIGVEVEIEGCKGPITTFIVEPFIPHDQEYYLSISSERLGWTVNFSDSGGVEIDEKWDKVKSVFLPTEKSMTVDTIAPLVATLPLEVREQIGNFIMGVFAVFQDLDFSFIEMNPFTLINQELYPLDMRGELDECAAFRNEDKWGDLEFPMPFGRVLSPEEIFIDTLKEKVIYLMGILTCRTVILVGLMMLYRKVMYQFLQSNATLKFVLLNREGRIWKLIPGGGSSLIYVDAIGDLGYASELGNYTDYSSTSEEEMYQLTTTILNCATAKPDGLKRAFIIGGNISNTANIATTYNGLIRALREKKGELKAAKMHMFVRRGGQNYKLGLAKLAAVGEELSIPIQVYGPEMVMTGICSEAVKWIES